jgi:hypothetical protein
MPWLRLARWPGVFVLALGLCACATDRNTASEREIAAALQDAKALAARGYQPSGTHGSEQFVEAWTGPEGALIVNVIMPRDVVDAPVVVYLPGLAGPADEGERWRHAWAEAGYAVLSIQKPSAGGGRRAEGAATGAASMPPPPPQTATAASGPPSGTSAPGAPGGPGGPGGAIMVTHREVDAPTAIAARQALARFALDEIARRAQQRRVPYDRMDPTHIAMTGFDLGADTALTLAGARTGPNDEPMPAVPPQVRAFIALGPYVNVTRADLARVYASVSPPVLTVTGTADADRLGLVDDPHARLAPYTFMPAGAKGLLVLNDGLHDTLAGSLHTMDQSTRGKDARPAQRSGGPGGGGPGGGGPGGGGMGGGGMDGGMSGGGMGGGMSGGMGGGGMGGNSGSPPSGGGGRRNASEDETAQPQIEPYAQYVIVEQITTAYLDAYLKDDPIAREWLQRNAPRWIGARGQWQMK